MQPFTYLRAATATDAVSQVVGHAARGSAGHAAFLGGGTTLLDLMKLDVVRPAALVDVTSLEAQGFSAIEGTPQALRIGALARMADVAEHPLVVRHYPVVAQALQLAASQQLRNMARIGGNLLQRTRCHYFRDTTWSACNKRVPGAGCAALDGMNRAHAVLGTSNECIAAYPGDLAQALVALDASVETLGPRGRRVFRFDSLHRMPGATPNVETILEPGELVTAVLVPTGPHTRRSLYVKIRDRDSYAFALASAAVAIDLEADHVRDVRIGLGGVATVPWRARGAEAFLRGRVLDEAAAVEASELAFADARGFAHNHFKIQLGKRTVVRALLQAKAMEV